jgi:hypothetical protein
METVIISERKKSVITDSVLLFIFGAVPLFILLKWLILADDGRVFIIFLIIVTLFFPVVVLSGYIWDVKQKIILSGDGIKLCYGRNFVDIMHFEGSFTIPPDDQIPWDTITGFDINIYEYQVPAEGGGYSTSTKYSLIIKLKNIDREFADSEPFSRNYYAVGLGKFDEHPHTIVSICEKFQRDLK